MTLKIVGAGFGRTGTLSFKAALEELGFGPCYHMLEVMKDDNHAGRWHRAVTEQNTNWSEILADYRAAVDWPACYFWQRLADTYPDAKVILTARDVDRWYESISQTILPAMMEPARNLERHNMAAEIILNRTFDGRLADADYAKDVFRRHIDNVQASISSDRLLTYEVSSGWAPLCEFLDVPVPEAAFPRVNSTAEFRIMVGLDDA